MCKMIISLNVSKCNSVVGFKYSSLWFNGRFQVTRKQTLRFTFSFNAINNSIRVVIIFEKKRNLYSPSEKKYGNTNINMVKFSQLVIFGLLLINWKSYISDLALKTTFSKNRMRIIFFNIKIVNQLFMIHAFNHVSMLIQSR